MALKISETNKPWGLKLATCGESIDLDRFGIEHNRCIDYELILRITNVKGRSVVFEEFLYSCKCQTLGVSPARPGGVP